MTGYHTEQKQLLLGFLEENLDRAYTVEEVFEAMSDRCGGNAPAKSTLYRLMQRLVEEGAVKRLTVGNSRRFVYQMMGGETCHSHLHMKCRACGRMFHLEERVSHEIVRTLASVGGFSLSEADTILFGECAACHQTKEAHA